MNKLHQEALAINMTFNVSKTVSMFFKLELKVCFINYGAVIILLLACYRLVIFGVIND